MDYNGEVNGTNFQDYDLAGDIDITGDVKKELKKIRDRDKKKKEDEEYRLYMKLKKKYDKKKVK